MGRLGRCGQVVANEHDMKKLGAIVKMVRELEELVKKRKR